MGGTHGRIGLAVAAGIAAVYETADKATNMPIDNTSPKKVRQLVIRRLRGMLNGLERARRQPNRREAYYMSQAMECLRGDRLPESEQAVTSAVQLLPLPPDFAKKTESNQCPSLVQLRHALDQLEID